MQGAGISTTKAWEIKPKHTSIVRVPRLRQAAGGRQRTRAAASSLLSVGFASASCPAMKKL